MAQRLECHLVVHQLLDTAPLANAPSVCRELEEPHALRSGDIDDSTAGQTVAPFAAVRVPGQLVAAIVETLRSAGVCFGHVVELCWKK